MKHKIKGIIALICARFIKKYCANIKICQSNDNCALKTKENECICIKNPFNCNPATFQNPSDWKIITTSYKGKR